MRPSYPLLLSVLAAQQATATWNFFDNFQSPMYTTNECSDKQQAGFDWSDIQEGASNFMYGDFDFTAGWKCSNSVGKRDVLSKRSFGSKAIMNKIQKDKPATFDCKQRASGFSISVIQVSVSFDVELEMHFKMANGAVCKQYSSCSAEGSTIQNTQCGGAVAVDIFMGRHFTGIQTECQIALHRVEFDCQTGTGYVPPQPPVISLPASTMPPQPVHSTAPAEVPASSALHETASVENSGLSAMPTPPSSIHVPPALPTAPFANTSMPAVHTVVPPSMETTHVAAPTPEMPPPEMPAPTMPPHEVPPQESAPMVPPTHETAMMPPPPPAQAAPPMPPASPPSVLPKCMNTWLQVKTSCKDNTDASCYCANAEFTKAVIDCVSAWCGTDAETQQALTYLIGICAEHVPENPKIIEDCPPYIPLNPMPPAPPMASPPAPPMMPSAGASMGVSTGETTPMPTAPAASVPCTTITYGTTSLTVPLVHFTTRTEQAATGGPQPTDPVNLMPGPPVALPIVTSAEPPFPVSTLGTRTVAGSGTGALRPTSPAEFTGAAVPVKGSVREGAVLGLILAVLAL